jgi:hypothetical protein
MRKQAIKYAGELRNSIKTVKRKRTVHEVCEDIQFSRILQAHQLPF